MLKTMGAKSRIQREVPLIAHPLVDSNVLLVASNWGKKNHPSWYHNLKANPEVKLVYKGREASYIAEEIEDQEIYEEYWLLAQKNYIGYKNYRRKADRKIPLIALKLQYQ